MGRLRAIKDAKIKILDSKHCLNQETIKEIDVSNKDVYLEIGSGKGDFLIEKAIKYPDVIFVGFEKFSTVIYKAINKLNALENKLNNIFFINDDATNLLSYFKLGSISKIFLNFSDPWPKKHHEKNRLTSLNFQSIYKQLLSQDGKVEFKTDNLALYNYSLDLLKTNRISVLYNTDDLYKDVKNSINSDNVQSEYEKKFISKDITIKKIVWKYN